ncbi:MAG: ribosomal protein S18-alanine N-acetyltransferase [Candidatus Izemoplasmatales bacterium]|jgi:ribosomal-protein-alanine N-acetyltransferase|nr:ribosomal protein S18-alanine N-acetyltransferase [Candidatus Izemoplasmatales bacterium]MDD4354419.1 ribosomal protein S18-alanine N-acetyltransferase [Candidatus Izemoplasmatales bacterium]MDY0372548.1 ribosomal protein S18-alanine N-acetyltransferase [Candidatus Izemoplasmatales bacterium]NLF49156.1 ribosomal protein S18-alanine N-acetyltransferase [Acholeplasmataceae bacterium]
MTPSIRKMEIEHIPEVIRMDMIVLGHTLGEATLTNELTNNPFAHYFVLEDLDCGVLLGHIGLWIDVPNAQVMNFYLLPDYQHQGLGKMLFDYILDYIQAYAVLNLTLEVRESNLRAIHFYERLGFDKVAKRQHYYDDGEDALLMLKKCEGNQQ